MIKKTFVGAAALVFAALVVMALLPDRKDAGDSDLLATSLSTAPAANSYADYLKLKDSLKLSKEEQSQVGQCANDAACAARPWRAALARHAEALRHFDALRGKRFEPPEWADPSKLTMETPLPQLLFATQAGSLAVLKARDLREQGKAAEALEAALRIVEVGQAWQASGGPLLVYMVGSSLKTRGLQAMREAAGAGALPAAALARLRATRDNRDGLKRALRLEYMVSANLIARLKEQGFPSGTGPNIPNWAAAFYFKPNRTRALMAEDFRGMIAAIDQSCSPTPPAALQRSWWADPTVLTGNLIGGILHAIAVPNLDRLARRRCQDDFWIGATELTLAAKAFARQQGRPPSGVAELAPKFLPEPPRDPFTSQPLAYSADGTITSPGLDAEGRPLAVRVAF